MNILNCFFNHKSDANKYLTAEQQEDMEKDFELWHKGFLSNISERLTSLKSWSMVSDEGDVRNFKYVSHDDILKIISEFQKPLKH